MIKNKITDFCKDKFKKNFIIILYIYFIIFQFIMVRLLGFEPRTSWSVAKRSIQLSYRRKEIYDKINIISITLLKIYSKI